MATTNPPRSQKADERPMAFRLENGAGGDTTVPLVIRPEDLDHSETALETAIPTLGGAFIDNFGPGLASIKISGTTGWGSNGRKSGFDAFKELHDAVWTEWHASRKRAVEEGRSPLDVKLTFIDDLDELCFLVSPGAFSLRRNKSSPLLMRYSISMTVLSDQIQPPVKDALDLFGGGSASSVKTGLSSLKASIKKIEDGAAKLRGVIGGSLGATVLNVANKASASLGKVVSVVTSARGIVTAQASQFVGIAQDMSLVGRNLFQTYAAITTLPDFVKHQVATVAGAFNNAFCVLKNAFKRPREYADYDALYGASNCSSTVGGSPISPLADRNPWEVILPMQQQVASVTPEARSSIEAMKATDAVLAPMGLADLGSRLTKIDLGVKFPWL